MADDRILVVDDDDSFLLSLRQILETMGKDVKISTDLAGARKTLDSFQPDWLLLDLILGDGSGLELLDDKRLNATRIVIMTGHPGVKDMIESLGGPNVDYLTKPVSLKDLQNVFSQKSRGANPGPAASKRIVGESPAMDMLREEIARVAVTDVPVMINGESGVGKELVAEAIHSASGRAGPYTALNCGAVNRDLVGSELFGHEKGSFTGAHSQHVGYFERARGGTLFLDEITEMPIEHQPQLLRALENKRITRLGGSKEIEVDARIVSACNRDPEQAISEGFLREDLYFRLAVFPIRVPPLRERSTDIDLLAEHFVDEFNAAYGLQRHLTDASLETLRNHGWPGNVRELRHVIQRAYIMANEDTGEISVPDRLASPLHAARPTGLNVGMSIREMERQLITQTLEEFDGDKPRAAKVLGVSLKTLYNRLNEYEAEASSAS